MTDDARHVYVHVPFCARRCSYCDFAIAVRREVPVDEYIGALQGELSVRLSQNGKRQRIKTLYFGGGTPSQLGPDGVRRMLDVLAGWFEWTDDAEVTLEANPDDVHAAAATAWWRAGINRVSLGAQSFDPAVLSWMHRSHTSAQIESAVQVIRDTPFRSWSFDLIFAMPDTVRRDWDHDLTRALELRPPHLSLYGLTIEPGTALGKWADRGEVQRSDDSRYEQEFLSATVRASAAGYEHYEVSNFALPGHGAAHNRSYWRSVPYLGFGPSAHGFDGHERRWNQSAYAAWRDEVSTGRDPVAGRETIGEPERALERLYLGLRTTAGLEVTAGEESLTRSWVSAGWATLAGGRLVLTPTGWLRLDALVSALALPQTPSTS
jgi:oxygen-independent coproporphyrinogen III oxidase